MKSRKVISRFPFPSKQVKSTTKAAKSTFETGDRTGIFAMLTGNSLDKQRYIDNLLLECGEGSKLIPKKEVYYPEGDATLDFISYYPYQTASVSKGSSLLNVAVQADQSKTVDYSLSNFMTARIEDVSNSEKTVKLEYKHQFAENKVSPYAQRGRRCRRYAQSQSQNHSYGIQNASRIRPAIR